MFPLKNHLSRVFRKAIETIATNDIENAKNLYEHYKDVLFSFGKKILRKLKMFY